MSESMTYRDHKEQAEESAVRCAVITVSDTRTTENDRSGALVLEGLRQAGHTAAAYHIVPDESPVVSALISELTGQDIDAILLNGGTGISKRDRTFEAVSAVLEKTLPGFGELFRMLSYQEIGAGAMLSRAAAGIYRGCLIFSMPGSPHAVELAMSRLILPELQHLVWELRRQV